MEQEKRQGRGTSSNAYKIVASVQSGEPSAAFYTYAEEVAIEKLIGRPIQEEVTAKSLKWGNLMECVVYNALPMVYSMTHKKTILHPKKGHIWSGTPDLEAPTKTGEIKCYWLKQFIKFAIALMSKDIEKIKKEFPQPYWQLVSNCILTKKSIGELIVFIPRRSQLEKILVAIEDTDFLIKYNLDPKDYYFYRPENIESLPYMPDDTKFDNLHTFEFEIPLKDKMHLIKKYSDFEKEVDKILKTLTT